MRKQLGIILRPDISPTNCAICKEIFTPSRPLCLMKTGTNKPVCAQCGEKHEAGLAEIIKTINSEYRDMHGQQRNTRKELNAYRERTERVMDILNSNIDDPRGDLPF